MRIDNNTPVTGTETTSVRASSARPEKKTVQPEDHVELSAAAAQSDTSRAARIEQLRMEVQQGSYRPSSRDIAAKIVDDMIKP